MQARKELSKEMPVKQVLARHKTAVVIGMLLTWFLTACVMDLVLRLLRYLVYYRIPLSARMSDWLR
jgi:hypothetical protein